MIMISLCGFPCRLVPSHLRREALLPFGPGIGWDGRFPVQFDGICGLGIETFRKKAVEGASWDPALVEGIVFTPA